MVLNNISKNASIGKNVFIGDFSIIEDDVIIGDNVYIGSGVLIYNGSRIADNVKIYHASTIGAIPNSVDYKGENTTVEIGAGTIIKEHTLISKGTKHSYKTVIGEGCFIMDHVHIGHDAIIGNNVILTVGCSISGHVEIGDYANIGGMTGIHQFCRIGKYCMVPAMTGIGKDIPPFSLAARNPVRYISPNTIGLRRKGFTKEEIEEIKEVYNIIYFSGYNTKDAIRKIKENFQIKNNVKDIIDFIESSKRGIIPSIKEKESFDF